MPFIKGNGERKACPWNPGRKGKVPGEVLGEGIQKKQLHIARKALRAALDSGEMVDAISAIESLSKLPERYRDDALEDINHMLAERTGGDAEDVSQIHVLSFVLMNLNKNGWAMLDSWERTQPLLDKHSELLANTLFIGTMNGTGPAVLETLGFIANCGSYAYDAETLRYILQRTITKPEMATGFYNLTGVLAREGTEEHRVVAQEMEDERIERAIEKLEYGNNEQVLGVCPEFILLVSTGRSYLAPKLDSIRKEMLDLIMEPGVHVEDSEEDEEAKQMEQEAIADLHARAASILRHLESLGMPMFINVDGGDIEALSDAGDAHRLLLAHGVGLNIVVGGNRSEDELRAALGEMADGYLHMESDGDEAARLIQTALSMDGCDEGERASAISRLRELQDRGLSLSFGVNCSDEHDPAEQAEDLVRILSVFRESGIDAKVTLTGRNAHAVNAIIGPDDSVELAMEEEAAKALPQEEATMLLQVALFPPEGRDSDAIRSEAITMLKAMQGDGMELVATIECPEEASPEAVASHLNLALDILSMNGVYPEIRLTGGNAQAVARLMDPGE